MTVDAIKDAINALRPEERNSLATWLNGLAYDEWDKQMVDDFLPGGRGAAFVEQIKLEVATGRTAPLREGLARARSQRDKSLR